LENAVPPIPGKLLVPESGLRLHGMP
jgi:hypothetical protein